MDSMDIYNFNLMIVLKKRLLLRGYGEIPIKINPIGEQDAKRQYC